MRILVTGFTSSHVGRTVQMNIFSIVPAALAALREAGHEIVQRDFFHDHEAPLDGYDLLLIGLGDPSSMPARWGMGALYTLARARAAELPILGMVDDWQFFKYRKSFRRFGSPERVAKRLAFNRTLSRHDHDSDELDDPQRIAEIAGVSAILGQGLWPPTLFPLFPWADVIGAATLAGIPLDRLIWADPSGFCPLVTQSVAVEERKRAWIMASLGNQENFVKGLGVSWPVHHYGNRRSHQIRLTEAQVAEEYTKHWGVLSQYYRPASVGWWRNRLVYAMHAEAIIAGDSREFSRIAPHCFLPPHQIETLSDVELERLAKTQRRYVMDRLWPRERFIIFMNCLVRSRSPWSVP